MGDCVNRTVRKFAAAGGIYPVSYTHLDVYKRQDKLPANLLQAMRDCFGAHGYRREDDPNGEPCHTDWTGRGGKIGSGAYNA